MKLKLRTSLGTKDTKAFGLGGKPLERGAVVDVTTAQAEAMRKKYKAVFDESETVRGVAATPAVRGVPEESPVSDTNAADAIEAIGRMTSKEKLQHIADNDPRVTVKDAAKKRLAAL